MRKIYFVLINFQHLEFIYSLHGIWVVIWIIHTHFYTFLHRQWIRNDIKHDIILRASFVFYSDFFITRNCIIGLCQPRATQSDIRSSSWRRNMYKNNNKIAKHFCRSKECFAMHDYYYLYGMPFYMVRQLWCLGANVRI